MGQCRALLVYILSVKNCVRWSGQLRVIFNMNEGQHFFDAPNYTSLLSTI